KMIPGTATRRIKETIGDDWVWTVQFRHKDTGAALDLSEATLTATLWNGSASRVIAISKDANPSSGNAVISVEDDVTALYPPGNRTRLVIGAQIDDDVRTLAIVGLLLIDVSAVPVTARSSSDTISVTAERPTITVLTDPFGADLTAPSITTSPTANCAE